MCAKKIAPASFGALLQLPKEQLRDLVDKQPQLKVLLRDFVLKTGNNRSKTASFLEIFGEEPPTMNGNVNAGAVATVPRSESPSVTPQVPLQALSPPTAV